MSVTSINTNLAAYYAQTNIGTAQNSITDSVARLSSGNAIVNASDNVAGLSIGTTLASNVSTLKVAQQNASQGNSLLQVASGALTQITDILQRQQELSAQAASGSLTSTQRGFLDQEFQALTSEINSLVDQTNFNGLNLLDGTLSQQSNLTSATTQSNAGQATVSFGTNPTTGQTVIVNGITITATTGTGDTTHFEIGDSAADTVANIAAMLTNLAQTTDQTQLGQALYRANGATLTIASRTGGALSNNFIINTAGTATSTTAKAAVGGSYGGSFNAKIFATGFTSATSVVASATATVATPFGVNDVLKAAVNGKTVTLYTVATGDSLQSIINGINSTASKTGISATMWYNSTNSTYNMRLNSNTYVAATSISFIDAGYKSGATAGAITSHTATSQSTFGLSGGADTGLGMGDTSVTGTVGDTVLTSLGQTNANVILSVPAIANSALSTTLNGETISLGGLGPVGTTIVTGDASFTFVTGTPVSSDQIQIGSTLQATMANAAATINSYFNNGSATGDAAYMFNQMNVTSDGTSLMFTGKNLNTVKDMEGNTVGIQTTLSNATTTNSGKLNNGSASSSGTFGVDTTGVSNPDFTGTLSGFTGTYDSANTANFAITVGGYTYTATNVTTDPTSNTTVRFYSNTAADGSNGGYFDIQMAANKGAAISNQAGADSLADHLNAAFSSLNFQQERNVSSYNGTQTIVSGNTVTGSLVGSSVAAQLSKFDAQKVSGITVTAPSGSSTDAQIAINVGNETFTTAAGIGDVLGANQTYRLTSTTNANDYLDFTTGNSTIDLSTSANALAAQNALLNAFGATSGSAAITFQVGTSSADTIAVSIANVGTSSLFNGQKLDLLTQDDANAAGTAISTALNTVTAVQATVGALEESFNYASANLSTSIQNQGAAESQFLDTDVSSESTNFATEQVKLQAGISVLAQANQLGQDLLKLIG